ncbi:MAG: class I SAM-dependent methyltransferase [Candidatus Nanohaloarchaea archaeon]
MEDHMFEPEMAGKLEQDSRYRYVSREELLEHLEEGQLVADIGSGTGFFTDDIAEVAEKVFAVDFQREMHDHYSEKGVPGNVELITSRASEFTEEGVDRIFSIFSFHEIDLEPALERFTGSLVEGGKLVVFDWSSRAESSEGPPDEKRFDADSAENKVSEYLEVTEATERRDTFRLVAENRSS